MESCIAEGAVSYYELAPGDLLLSVPMIFFDAPDLVMSAVESFVQLYSLSPGARAALSSTVQICSPEVLLGCSI